MVTPSVGFRLTENERRTLDRLAAELACSRTDVIRYALAILRRDPQLRRDVKAETFARAFLARLRERYGRHAILMVEDGPDRTDVLIDREPVDDVEVRVRREDGMCYLDLIDPMTNVGIRNAYWTDDAEEHVAIGVPLHALWVASLVSLEEPEARRLPDGKTGVAIEEDGVVKTIVLGEDGTSHLLHEDQRAAWFTP